MGCISSKVVIRSMSFRDELNQRLQRKVNGFTSSGSVGDETLSGNLTLQSNTCTKEANDLERNETSDSLQLTSRVEQEEEKQIQQAFPLLKKATESIDADLAERSKSCHWLQELEMFSVATERSNEIKEERFMWSKSGKIRAWSFHTIEEYDAMSERICLSRDERAGFDGKDAGCRCAEQAMKQSPLRDESQVEENNAIEEKGSNVVEDTSQNSEKGFRRKAMANELESLNVPTTIEIHGSASLKEWLDVGGQVYSPGTYVTPKFGSYTIPTSESANNCSGSAIFYPELVAAFVKCMEKLEVEEESILKQIEDDFNGENTKEKQDQEEISFHTNEQL